MLPYGKEQDNAEVENAGKHLQRQIVAFARLGSAVCPLQPALDRALATMVQASGWIKTMVDDKLDGRIAIELIYLNTVNGLYYRGYGDFAAKQYRIV